MESDWFLPIIVLLCFQEGNKVSWMNVQHMSLPLSPNALSYPDKKDFLSLIIERMVSQYSVLL